MLCLHGYHGSGAILRRQMAPLAGFLAGFCHQDRGAREPGALRRRR
jgi:hypothetical protein